nr:MAG TPA: hypothetical protein [Caudoviricetes sp.]
MTVLRKLDTVIFFLVLSRNFYNSYYERQNLYFRR